MIVSHYIADFLASHGVTDAFGIPGGVILDLIYALDAKHGITPHLSYHEQSAGFAACGYAQASGKVGVAYATRGPGFTNLLSPMADAYYDSIPVIFITGHTTDVLPTKSRIIEDQEMDSCAMVRNITKYAKRVDKVEDIESAFDEAYKQAMTGRKGPVFLDIKTALHKQEITPIQSANVGENASASLEFVEVINSSIKEAKRPIILIGDGINQANVRKEFNEFIVKANVPVLSSRYSHYLVEEPSRYYGYVGSHGIRYANFILSKVDLIITLGNRLAFPAQSSSYSPIVENAKIIRFDVDEGEFERHTAINNRYLADLNSLMSTLATTEKDYGNHEEWMDVCNKLREDLWNEDVDDAVNKVNSILAHTPSDYTIINDVGNIEFWMSRACVNTKIINRTLYSKSFGAMGNAIGKSIGAYYATGKPVLAFIGDQALQLNIQELQYISQHHLPVAIVLLNNASSGMIKDRETASKRDYYLHTTLESGYGIPDFRAVAYSYRIRYEQFEDLKEKEIKAMIQEFKEPLFIEIRLDENIGLNPSLPKGKPCQDMTPELDRERYNNLNKL